jgi:hypothetical protein
MTTPYISQEAIRLEEDAKRVQNWKRWGTYLPERQWATVREDYSSGGSSWNYFTHDDATRRAYRWGEDGILGWTDRECRLCLSFSLWNGQDSILKERFFGLSGPQGNHGEDVKELYYYLDATPTHSYCKALYKYPQKAFPYQDLIETNQKRSKHDREYELLDTGVFNENRYFDVQVEYAKGGPHDTLMRLTIYNRGPAAARLHVLPTIWFRNTWIWGCNHEGCTLKPKITQTGTATATLEHQTLGQLCFAGQTLAADAPIEFVFTDNESDSDALWGDPCYTPYVKNAFHRYLIQGQKNAVNPAKIGTKAALHYPIELQPQGSVSLNLRLWDPKEQPLQDPFEGFEAIFEKRIQEADDFYKETISKNLSQEEQSIQRQAYAGLLWTKQFYHYSVKDWLKGDPSFPPPPNERSKGRNADWEHLFNRDILSVPDKWEYPWYAAWDLAFHMIPFAKVDPHFAKHQLLLLLREWYMHPNGQIPAYEYAFGDVNPPVHAWACWRVYKMTAPKGERDLTFLAECFHKLLINFTWWVNRKDPNGKNLFSGGFLGLDNIGAFDRSRPLPHGGHLEQADGTAWMAFYCTTMLSMALELAYHDPAYDGVASKFFEHFMAITQAINTIGKGGLWDENDGFYYDQLYGEGHSMPLKIRSMVGLIPLLAVEVLESRKAHGLPGFRKRMEWFVKNRRELSKHISLMLSSSQSVEDRALLAITSRVKLERVFKYLFDSEEFLSPYGIRSLSKYHGKNPFSIELGGEDHRVHYVPGESDSGLFGGNSNWRGPIWFPINFLLIEALQKYHYFYGDQFKVEFPTGSGQKFNLREIASFLTQRLTLLFKKNPEGFRPCHGPQSLYVGDPHFKDLILFYEYFHADTGEGLGASHQTGWTALVAKLFDRLAADGCDPHLLSNG